ncbi:MAG: hypothetical protein ACXW29_13215 [Thermoanaerobaculia bacterium]
MEKSGLDRRTFITVGTAAVLGLTAARPSHAAVPQMSQFLSVGVLQPVPTLARRFGGRAGFAPAEKITTSNPSLVRTGARVTIEGLWLPESSRNVTETILVDALFTPEREVKVPFYAWSYVRAGGRENRSGRASFTTAIETGSTLDLNITHSEMGSGKIAFSVLPSAGAVMLNHGVYVVAFRKTGVAALPDWSDVRMNPDVTPRTFSSRPEGLLYVQSGGRDLAPWFEYLVLSVDVRD